MNLKLKYIEYDGARHGDWCRLYCYETNCFGCGSSVFYWECRCGSKVFFESLGKPWPTHGCSPIETTEEKIESLYQRRLAVTNYFEAIETDIKFNLVINDLDVSRWIGMINIGTTPVVGVICRPQTGQHKNVDQLKLFCNKRGLMYGIIVNGIQIETWKFLDKQGDEKFKISSDDQDFIENLSAYIS